MEADTRRHIPFTNTNVLLRLSQYLYLGYLQNLELWFKPQKTLSKMANQSYATSKQILELLVLLLDDRMLETNTRQKANLRL